MADLQQQARALGDPTRHQIFRLVADAERPVTVAELTEHLGLNHNAIRQHLAKLVAADLMVESTAARSGPGRPKLQYEVEATVDGRWGVTGPYERLARWLAEVVRTGNSPREVGRRAGAASMLVAGEHLDGLDVLESEMARQGFEPMREERADGVDLVLQRCPFASTAEVDPHTVCNLHLGFAEGISEATGGITVGGLQPHDPRIARCRLRLREDPA
jgi:predicted ArsR family transcriptional regulator